MARTRVMTVRVSDDEYRAISKLAEKMGCSKAEVWRRLLWTVRIIFDQDLPATDALDLSKGLDDRPLVEVLRPIPYLVEVIARRRGERLRKVVCEGGGVGVARESAGRRGRRGRRRGEAAVGG